MSLIKQFPAHFLARMMSPQIPVATYYPTQSMSSTWTISQEKLSYRRGPIPAQTNIPNFTFQYRESQSYTIMLNSGNTSERNGRNTNENV